jgi:hypothetical protein
MARKRISFGLLALVCAAWAPALASAEECRLPSTLGLVCGQRWQACNDYMMLVGDVFVYANMHRDKDFVFAALTSSSGRDIPTIIGLGRDRFSNLVDNVLSSNSVGPFHDHDLNAMIVRECYENRRLIFADGPYQP